VLLRQILQAGSDFIKSEKLHPMRSLASNWLFEFRVKSNGWKGVIFAREGRSPIATGLRRNSPISRLTGHGEIAAQSNRHSPPVSTTELR
jgi:hypothetical protein